MAAKFTPHYYPNFGDKCHQQADAVFPVMVVTDLDNKILLSNFPTEKTRWVITKGRTNINTYWDASTAYFQCVLQTLDVTEDLPPAPAGAYRHPFTRMPWSKVNLSESTDDTVDEIKSNLKANSSSGVTLTAKEAQDIVTAQGLAKDITAEKINALKNNPDKDELNQEKFFDLLKVTIDTAKDEQAKAAANPTAATVDDSPLNYLDEICIYLGYLPAMRPVTTQDILDNRLLRRGVWVVDTLTVSGGGNSNYFLTVQCRDRLKYLMDTFGSYNTAEGDNVIVKDFKSNDAEASSPFNGLKRSGVVLKIAQRGIGQVNEELSVGGRFIREGFIYDIKDVAANEVAGKTAAEVNEYDAIYDQLKGGTIPEGKEELISNLTASLTSRNLTADAVRQSYKDLYKAYQDRSIFNRLPTNTPTVESLELDSDSSAAIGGLIYTSLNQNPYLSEDQLKVWAPLVEQLATQLENTVPAAPPPDPTAPDYEPTGFDPYMPYKGDIAAVGAISDAGIKITKVITNPQKTTEEALAKLNNADAEGADVNAKARQVIFTALGVAAAPTVTPEQYEQYLSINSTASAADGSTFSKVNSLQGRTYNTALSKELRFNIITGRAPYAQKLDAYLGQNFVVAERVPLSYIKFLSQQEPWPTTVFQDSRTGEYWYVPRGLDVSGLSDPKRFNRTYFFRQFPPNLTEIKNPAGAAQVNFPNAAPHKSTMLHSFREEVSSISMRTNILVQTSAAGNLSGNTSAYLHISVLPPGFDNRAYACSYFTITDDTASQNPGALIAVAMSYARVVGKEVRAAAATMCGDPSIVPGEAIQVIGSPAHQKYTTGKDGKVTDDRAIFYDMSTTYQSLYLDLGKLQDELSLSDGAVDSNPKALPGTENIMTNSKGGLVSFTVNPNAPSVNDLMERSGQDRADTGMNTIMFKAEPSSMWRVEATIDRFNDGVDGYYTELSLLSCF